MLYERRGKRPIVDSTAAIGPNAVFCGDVRIGPRSYLAGCTIADDVFLATGATVFNHTVIDAPAEVPINGTVHLKTRLTVFGLDCSAAGGTSMPDLTRRYAAVLAAHRNDKPVP